MLSGRVMLKSNVNGKIVYIQAHARVYKRDDRAKRSLEWFHSYDFPQHSTYTQPQPTSI